MKFQCFLLALACVTATFAQSAAPQPNSHPLGFSYSLPEDWEILDTTAKMAESKRKVAEESKSAAEKKGAECAEAAMTARHQGSVIMEIALPFDCLGSTLDESVLPNFGTGVAEGIKKTFTVTNPTSTTYASGTHHFWAQRSKATPNASPDRVFTLEVACTVLKKGIACWLLIAGDDSAIDVFEHGAATLEADPPVALVPPNSFTKSM